MYKITVVHAFFLKGNKYCNTAGPNCLKLSQSQIDDQGIGEVYGAVIPDNLTQEAENMLILDNEKAHLLGNFLKRYFFRETGFVSVI